jgi:hypothetical protein
MILLILYSWILQILFIFAHQTFGTSFLINEENRINGRLTEWLGSGLQNRLRRFESATDLNLKPYQCGY